MGNNFLVNFVWIFGFVDLGLGRIGGKNHSRWEKTLDGIGATGRPWIMIRISHLGDLGNFLWRSPGGLPSLLGV